MNWLRHLLPKTSDFLYSYAPSHELLPDEGAPITTKTGFTGTFSPVSREFREGLPPLTGHEDLIGHPQGNAVETGFPTNQSHHLDSDSAPTDGREGWLMNKLDGNKTILKEVLKHVIPGARYNSSARDPPPRCCSGTRERILKDTSARIQDSDTKLIWLFGPAGSGKTAVMQTLAETYSSRGISATLFLSRDMRDDPNKIFTSLAYDFAVANPTYRHFIGEELASDPDFLSLSMAEQFRRLFIQPFLNHAVSDDQRWVVFLDGLDECRSDTSQCKAIDLIRDSILLHPEPMPLLWIISSRPEVHLGSSFEAIKKVMTGFWEVEVPVTTREASKDVERYLHTELSNIAKIYPYSMLSSPWPPEKEVLELADTCSGFFLFASLAMEYISGMNAVSRLNVFSPNHIPDQQLLTPSPFSGSQQEKRLHLMYAQIMSSIPGDVLPCTKAILGYYVLQQVLPVCPTPGSVGLEHLDLLTVCNILDIKKHNAFAALLPLSPLVRLPSPEEAGNFGVQFLHSSFPDFLRTSFLNRGELVNKTWQCYLRILQQFKEKQEPSGIHVCWPASGGNDIQQEALFQIARHGWMTLLITSKIGFRLSLHSEPIDAFKEFGPNLIAYFAETQIAEFTEWITKHASRNLRETIIRRSSYDPTSLGSLDMDKVFRAGSARCCRIVTSGAEGVLAITDLTSSSTTLDRSPSANQYWNISSILGEIATVRASRRDVPVQILRQSGDNYEARAVVGPIDGYDPLGNVYYILPYC